MINVLLKTTTQKNRTVNYPKSVPTLPERFRGLPLIDPSKCAAGCQRCLEVCPTNALTEGLKIDLGRCLFCNQCLRACPQGAISFSQEHRLAARSRNDLVLSGGSPLKLIESLDKESRRLFGRSFKLREVSAGGCNACEADTNVLSTDWLGSGTVRRAICCLPAPCGRFVDYGTGYRQYAAGAFENL